MCGKSQRRKDFAVGTLGMMNFMLSMCHTTYVAYASILSQGTSKSQGYLSPLFGYYCCSNLDQGNSTLGLIFISSFRSSNFSRVLDLSQVNLGGTFPREIELLVQLRSLAVLGDMKSIPTSIASLSNLETLILDFFARY